MRDLSELAGKSLGGGGGSMQATNTVSDRSTMMTAPGSDSEAVRPEDVRSPVMDIPAVRASATTLSSEQSPWDPDPWRRPDGSPWESAEDIDGGNDTSGGRWNQS